MTAPARSGAIFATKLSNKPPGAWMYSRSERSLHPPHFHPLSSIVWSLDNFRSAALPNMST